MIELKDTVKLMNSKNATERLAAEYWQLKIRYKKLVRWIGDKANANNVDALHYQQAQIMANYLHLLKLRAAKMGVNLSKYYMQIEGEQTAKKQISHSLGELINLLDSEVDNARKVHNFSIIIKNPQGEDGNGDKK